MFSGLLALSIPDFGIVIPLDKCNLSATIIKDNGDKTKDKKDNYS